MKKIELFFWGILTALGALLVEVLIAFGLAAYQHKGATLDFEFFNGSLALLVVFVLIEELFKYLIIAKKIEALSLGRSFIFNSLFIGAGFALTEIGLIVLQSGGFANEPSALGRIAIVHIATAGIMGYSLALGNPKRVSTAFKALLVPSILHLAYNLLAFKGNDFGYVDQLVVFLLTLLVFSNIANIIRLPKKLAS